MFAAHGSPTSRTSHPRTSRDARANLGVLTRALATESPDSMEHSELWVVDERRARPAPLVAELMAPLLITVMALASLVLLIACANVGTLLFGYGISRRREVALRAGLGGTVAPDSPTARWERPPCAGRWHREGGGGAVGHQSLQRGRPRGCSP